VSVRGAPPADWSAPEKLSKVRIFSDGPEMFDVAADGRFLMLKIGGGSAGPTTPDSLIVVQNWTEELKRLCLPSEEDDPEPRTRGARRM
jgi:hypothetical protein